MNAQHGDVVSGNDSGFTQTPLYPGLQAGTCPLQVVLLIPQLSPHWLADLVGLADAGPSVAVSVVAITGDLPTEPAPMLPLDMRVYLALERLRHRHLGDRLTRVDMGAAGSAQVQAGDSAARVADVVASLQPDLVILNGPQSWQPGLATIARHGCWQIDNRVLHARYAGLPLLLPVLAGADTSAIDLVLADQEGTFSLLASSVGTTHPGSFHLQRDQAFAKLPAMLLRSLRQLAHGNAQWPVITSARLMVMPSARFRLGQGVRALLTALRHTARWQIQKRRTEEPWFLLMRRGGQLLDPENPVLGDFAMLVAPDADYWADPCAVERDGHRLVFVEEYSMRTRKAVIACLELLPDGRAERLGIALDEPYHLSYPQVFECEGQWYLTVESGVARCVRLYRASDFPLRWKPVTDLISDRVSVDPTLHYHRGHWYLFVNISESGGSTSEELFLFVSEQLAGPYRPHPANPIVSDVRRARPAGRLFAHQGRLIRPGQDCAASYGSAIVFSEVLELSPERYREQVLARLDGSWSSTLNGCHTYSAVGSLEVLDARGKVPTHMRQMPVVYSPISRRASEREVPLVSVLMIAQGDVSWLRHAVENVLEQSFSDQEILIASNDPAAIESHLGEIVTGRLDRVRVIGTESRNRVQMVDAIMAQARGRYLAWYEPGYRWIKQHLEGSLDWLERDSALGMVHAQVLALESSSTLFGRSLAREHMPPRITDPYAALLLWISHPVAAAVVARRSTTLTVGGFDNRFACLAHSERDYWLRIAAIADIGTIASGHVVPVAARKRGNFDEDVFWDSRRMLVEKHIHTAKGRALRHHALAALDADRATGCAAHAGFWAALPAFAHSLRRHPLRWRVWHDMLRWVFHIPGQSDHASR